MRKKPYERIIKEVQKMLEEKIDIRSISIAMNMSEETINEIKEGTYKRMIDQKQLAKQMQELYDKRYTLMEISEETGWSYNTVSNLVKREIKHHLTEEKIKQAIDMFESGKSIKEVAKFLDRDETTFYRHYRIYKNKRKNS